MSQVTCYGFHGFCGTIQRQKDRVRNITLIPPQYGKHEQVLHLNYINCPIPIIIWDAVRHEIILTNCECSFLFVSIQNTEQKDRVLLKWHRLNFKMSSRQRTKSHCYYYQLIKNSVFIGTYWPHHITFPTSIPS